MANTIRTERLVLKLPALLDVHAILNFVKRNRAFLQEWEPTHEDEYYTTEYQLSLMQDEIARIARGEAVKLWIYEGDEVIGSVALTNIIRGAFQSCYLGYRMDEKRQGQGYMTEALRPVIDLAFGQLDLHRIEANIMPRNAASLRVVEKQGFVNEGVSQKYLRINGKWEDHIHMVLLNQKLE